MRILIYIIAVFLASTVNGVSKNLYVNNSGSPECSDSTTYANNTALSPWCTLGRATWGNASRASSSSAQAAQAGDVVYVTAGTYSGAGTNDRYEPLYATVNSGTSGSPITIEAVGTVNLTLSSGSGPVLGVAEYGVEIGGVKSYITYKGFTINEATAPPLVDAGLVMFAGGTGNRLENCTLIGDTGSAVENNHAAIWLVYETSPVIKNNSISGFLNNGAYHHNAPGVMFYGATTAIIEHNYIENCGSGVFIKGYDNDSNIVRYNYITGCGSGIKTMTVIGTHKIYQNIVIGRSGGSPGLSCHPAIDDGIRGTVYQVNNTLINSYLHWPYSINSTANIYSANNIIAYTTGSSYGVEVAYWDRLTQLYFDYHVYYNVANWYGYNNQEYSSIATWRTALGGSGDWNDNNSITSDPLFVGSGNYKLQAGSPALTLGVDILDLDGDSSTVDNIPAGAYITGNETIGVESTTPARTAAGVTFSRASFY